MKSTDIYLCKVQVKEFYKIVRNVTFKGITGPFKVIEPNPTLTQLRQQAESKKRTAEMRSKMIAEFAAFMERQVDADFKAFMERSR
jgi:hypothetical protein